MPFHCQKKALFEAGTYLPWEFETQENPKKIKKQKELPKLNYSSSRSDAMMSYALKSTAKDDDEDEEEDDDTAPCEYDEDGRPKCAVQSERWIENPVYIDASQSGDKGGPKLGKGVPENLKDLVLGLADHGKCGEVFEQLIQTSSKKFKEWQKKSQKSGKSIIETIYDSLKSVKIDPTITSYGGNAGGHITFVEDFNNDSRRGLIGVWTRFAVVTVQEMIHQVFDDRDLLTASQALIDSGNLDPSIKNIVDNFIRNSKDKKLYEHNVLGAACSPTDADIINLWNTTQFNLNPFSDPYWNFP